jgi:hypothetical protein
MPSSAIGFMFNVIGEYPPVAIVASWEIPEPNIAQTTKKKQLVVYDDDDTYRQAEECQTQISYIYMYNYIYK